jgi:tetratricopeptide (TPR) repeat protein
MSGDSQLRQSAKDAIARGEYAFALGLLRDVVAFAPEDYEAHMLLGACLGKVGRVTEAVRSLRQAVWLNPRSVQAQYNFGKILYQAGELNEAADHLEQALALDNQYEKAYTLLKDIRALLRPKSAVSATPTIMQSSNRTSHIPKVSATNRRSMWGTVMLAIAFILAICVGIALPILKERLTPVPQPPTITQPAPVITYHPKHRKPKKKHVKPAHKQAVVAKPKPDASDESAGDNATAAATDNSDAATQDQPKEDSTTQPADGASP